MEQQMLRACDWCGASGNTKLCGGCRTKWFCDNDKKCLKAAWKNGHKQECKAAKAEQDIKESEEQDSKPQMPVEQFDDIHPLLEILRIGFGEPAERAGMHTVLFLWRMRRLSKEFLIWANKILSQQPYLIVLGGGQSSGYGATGRVEWFTPATLRWTESMRCPVPRMPAPRFSFAAAGWPNGRMVIADGEVMLDFNFGSAGRVAQWKPNTDEWTELPPCEYEMKGHETGAASCEDYGSYGYGGYDEDDMYDDEEEEELGRTGTIGVALPDGRFLLAGGNDCGDGPPPSLVLDAEGTHWSSFAEMKTARTDAFAGVLPTGHIIVAGGQQCLESGQLMWPIPTLSSAEIWDPATQVWSDIAPMNAHHSGGVACVLPKSGRFAVIGGEQIGADGTDSSCSASDPWAEAYDPITGEWVPLPPMVCEYKCLSTTQCKAAAVVSGGCIIIGGKDDDACHASELFDEDSQTWTQLPHEFTVPRTWLPNILTMPASVFEANQARSEEIMTCVKCKGRPEGVFTLAECAGRNATRGRTNRDKCDLHRPRQCNWIQCRKVFTLATNFGCAGDDEGKHQEEHRDTTTD